MRRDVVVGKGPGGTVYSRVNLCARCNAIREKDRKTTFWIWLVIIVVVVIWGFVSQQ
jgi:hypothetical protein